MRRLVLITSETGLLKKEDISGASDTECFEVDGHSEATGCPHFIDSWKGESCGLFNEWFDGSVDNARLPQCLEAEKLAKDRGLA